MKTGLYKTRLSVKSSIYYHLYTALTRRSDKVRRQTWAFLISTLSETPISGTFGAIKLQTQERQHQT